MIKLHSPEPTPVNDQAVPSQRVEPARHEAMPDDVLGFDFLGSDVSGSEVLGSAALGPIDIEQQSQAESATGLRRVRALWPMALIAIAGVATVGWLIGLGWAAVELVRTFAG